MGQSVNTVSLSVIFEKEKYLVVNFFWPRSLTEVLSLAKSGYIINF